MIFKFKNLLDEDEKTLSVDGVFESEKNISHWPGNFTPEKYKADTTTEMMFKLLKSDAKEFLEDIDTVSNNHFDSDGVISAFCLIKPDYTLAHEKELCNIATTGDFKEFTTEDALKADIILMKLIDPANSPIKEKLNGLPFSEMMQLCYEKAFELLPKIIANPERFKDLYKDEFKFYQDSENLFETHQAIFSNYGDCNLSVIESSSELHKVCKYSYSEFDTILTSIKKQDGKLYEIEYKRHTWFDTTRDSVERKKFEPLAEKLNQIEGNENGNWKVLGKSPSSELDYRLQFSDEKFNLIPSKIELFEVENILFDYFFE